MNQRLLPQKALHPKHSPEHIVPGNRCNFLLSTAIFIFIQFNLSRESQHSQQAEAYQPVLAYQLMASVLNGVDVLPHSQILMQPVFVRSGFLVEILCRKPLKSLHFLVQSSRTFKKGRAHLVLCFICRLVSFNPTLGASVR